MKKALILFLSYILFAFVGCLETANQSPQDIFSDRKVFPAELEKRANPSPPWSVQEYLQNSPKQNVVRVAVVDSGVDYTNPNLFYQTELKIDGGRFVGSGIDLLGEDNWAHPNLVQSDFYAFMATSLQNRKILGAPDDAIREIFRINSELVANLQREVRQNPKLSDSIFGKRIHPKSVNFFMTRKILKDEFDQESYNNMKEKLTLITVENSKPGDKNEEVLLFDWSFGEQVDDAEFVSNFSNIEHSDLMYAVVQKVHTAFEEKYQIERRLLQVAEFNRINPADEYDFDEMIDGLHKKMGLLTDQYRRSSPISLFLKSYCTLVAAQYRNNPQMLNPDGSIRESHVVILRNKFFADVETYLKELKKLAKDKPEDIAKLDLMLADLPKLRQRAEPILDGLDPKLFNCSRTSLRFRDAHYEKIQRTKTHPLFSASSPASSHGSHVGGIILRQSPNVKVVPVRVTTQGTQTSATMDQSLKNQFIDDFSNWIFQDTIRETFLKRLSDLASGTDEVAVKNLVRKYVEDNFSKIKLNLSFFQEIQKAIEFIGQNKIKIANLSLGLNYEAPVATSQASVDKRIELTMQFLMIEYFKFSVAKTIEDNARQTLFVIASGNDGKWLDGKSRSGLPCDLSSSELKKSDAGKNVVNNRLKNILCVGSINPQDEVSSFSNIPLTDVPFVFGYGENILSTVQVNNCEGNQQDLKGEFGHELSYDLPSRLSSHDDVKIITEKIGWTKEDSPYEFMSRYRNLLSFDRSIFNAMGEIISNESCAERPKHAARMSGTSMATPAVAGYIARRLVAISRAEKLSDAEIYASEEYSPQNIIKALREKSPKFGGESIISSVAKVVRFRTWDQVIRKRAENSKLESQVIQNIQNAPLFDLSAATRKPDASRPELKGYPEMQNQFWPEFRQRTARTVKY